MTAWNAGLQTGTRGAPRRARRSANREDGNCYAAVCVLSSLAAALD